MRRLFCLGLCLLLATAPARAANLPPGFTESQFGGVGANIANGTITSTQIQDATITSADILNATITGADIAAAVGFLCSTEAGFITGQTLGVNGGSVM